MARWDFNGASGLRMSTLIYITNMSLDGYVEDETGAFDWVDPDQVFEFITD